MKSSPTQHIDANVAPSPRSGQESKREHLNQALDKTGADHGDHDDESGDYRGGADPDVDMVVGDNPDDGSGTGTETGTEDETEDEDEDNDSDEDNGSDEDDDSEGSPAVTTIGIDMHGDEV